MKGAGAASGAGTVINAIAAGRGCAFGIDLQCTAEVELFPGEDGIEVTIESDPGESTDLARRCVLNTLKSVREMPAGKRVPTGLDPSEVPGPFGARVTTGSDIPISRGLSSSSAAANAVVLATLDALGVVLPDLDIINIGIDSALDAGVTVTGAFDDATASYFGGLIFTDNGERDILRRSSFGEDLAVLIHVPARKIPKKGLPLQRLASLAPVVERAFDMAMEGAPYVAMTINGLAYSAALGISSEVATAALEAGARCAGLSGTGPATIAMVDRERSGEALDAMRTAGGEEAHLLVTSPTPPRQTEVSGG